jgi:hypothetical protein
MRSPALEAPGLPVEVQQARAWWGCRGLSCGYLLLKVILDIIANDASTGASPFDLAQVDGVLFSYMARQRGCLDHFPITTLFNRLSPGVGACRRRAFGSGRCGRNQSDPHGWFPGVLRRRTFSRSWRGRWLLFLCAAAMPMIAMAWPTIT